MTSDDQASPDFRPSEPAAGFVVRTMRRWFMRSAQVAAIEAVSASYRLITLRGEAFGDVAWSAGQKVQVAIGHGTTKRTYTPFSWDTSAGVVRLLAFLHGAGPGSGWAQDLQEGATVEFLGPRSSLDMSAVEAPIILFGDETAIALGAAIQGLPQKRKPILIFEVGDEVEARRVLARLGMEHAMVIPRQAANTHLEAVSDELVRHIGEDACFVLTGNAKSIQHASRALKAVGVSSSKIKAKAYWAPGKAGLD